MTTHTHHGRVRLTVECSEEERMYIKMLATKKHMTISEFILSQVKKIMPDLGSHKPNDETVASLRESREEKLESYKTVEDFWKAMGIDPNA
jgi:hypothetical protein